MIRRQLKMFVQPLKGGRRAKPIHSKKYTLFAKPSIPAGSSCCFNTYPKSVVAEDFVLPSGYSLAISSTANTVEDRILTYRTTFLVEDTTE